MKRFFTLLLVGLPLIVLTSAAYSQSGGQQREWAVSGSIGVLSLTTGGVGQTTPTPVFSLAGYRYISEIFDARVALDGFYMQSTHRWAGTNRNFKQITHYGNLHADLMLNVNHFTQTPHPIWNVQPFLGLGFWGGSTDCHSAFALSVNGGVNASIRFSERISFFAEGAFVVLPDDCDRYDNRVTYQLPLSLSLGVKFHFGKPVKKTKKTNCILVEKEIIRDTVIIIKEKVVERAVTVLPDTPSIAQPDTSDLPLLQELPVFRIYFSFNSSTVKRNNKVIRQVAEYLKENPRLDMEIAGYCFSQKKEAEETLPLKRANEVMNVLVTDYAISPERLKIKLGSNMDRAKVGLGRSVQMIPMIRK